MKTFLRTLMLTVLFLVSTLSVLAQAGGPLTTTNRWGTSTQRVVTVTATTYTVPTSIDVVFADASSNAITITLYTPVGNYAYDKLAGGKVIVIKTDTTQNAVTVATAAGSILAPTTLSAKYQSIIYESNGINWYSFEGVRGLGNGAASGYSVSPRLMHTGGVPAQVSTAGTDATPVATEVYIAEVFVPANTVLTGVSVMNGSVASGNIKVGLASSAGAVLATSASTAMSGTDAYQRIPFTATYAATGPATYYVLEFVDNNTARINTHTFGDFGASKQTGQVYATGFTTITPPTTFTTALGPIASLY